LYCGAGRWPANAPAGQRPAPREESPLKRRDPLKRVTTNGRQTVVRFTGSPTKLCDGLTRRDLLHLGELGAFGLTLPSFLKLKASESTRANDSAFGRAKACILLFPYGSPPQHETFDPKPDAPAEIQGELK